MSTLYFCNFLNLYFVHTNFYGKTGVSSLKNECIMLNLVFSAVPLLLRSRLCLKAFRQGHLLYRQISPVPDVPQISLTPQNVAINQGINLRVVPTSQDSLGRSYRRRSHLQQISSPNLSKIYSSDVHRFTDQTS